jgi:tetracycline repressor-like protein
MARNGGVEFQEKFRAQVIQPRRKALLKVLRGGQESGEISRDLDLDIAHQMLLAPVLMRLTSLGPKGSIPRQFLEQLVDTAMQGFRSYHCEQ